MSEGADDRLPPNVRAVTERYHRTERAVTYGFALVVARRYRDEALGALGYTTATRETEWWLGR